MARPKSQSVVNNSTVTSSEVNVEELMKKFQKMQEELESLKQNKNNNDIFTDDEIDTIDINPDSYIKVVSLCPWTLNLSTERMGRGKIFTFNSFGATKRIRYADLVNVLEVYQHFLEDGLFFVADKRIIRKHFLEDSYSKILTKENIEKIVDGTDADTAFSLFKSSTPAQQEMITQMLFDKRVNDNSVNMNLWEKIRREFKKNNNIDIDEKFQNTRDYVDSINQQKESQK